MQKDQDNTSDLIALALLALSMEPSAENKQKRREPSGGFFVLLFVFMAMVISLVLVTTIGVFWTVALFGLVCLFPIVKNLIDN